MEGIAEDTGGLEQLDWGYGIPEQASQKIKDNLKVIDGFDENKVLAGHVLERILGDDVNVFSTASIAFDKAIMKPEMSKEQKSIFLDRLRWELEQPQTPQDIKDSIVAVREKLQTVEWDSQESLRASRKHWEETVRAKVKAMIDANGQSAGEPHYEYSRFYEEVIKRGLPY